MALPISQRLKKKEDITRVFKTGRTFQGAHLFLKIIPAINTQRLWVVIVSNKTAPLAVTRNRLRRQVAEILRDIVADTTSGYHAALTVRTPELPDIGPLKKELLSLLEKSGILEQ